MAGAGADWLHDQRRHGPGLREECASVAETDWRLLERRAREDVHVAEVEYCPGNWPRDAWPLRYLAVRLTPTQGTLFQEGSGPKYLAVVTNREGTVESLLCWHWEKAGTIERVHDVVKNELGGGVLPCGRFGANATWFRIALLAYNVLSGLRRTALPPKLRDARPKRLRFEVFIQPAVLVRHARRLVARLRERFERARWLIEGRDIIWCLPSVAAA